MDNKRHPSHVLLGITKVLGAVGQEPDRRSQTSYSIQITLAPSLLFLTNLLVHSLTVMHFEAPASFSQANSGLKVLQQVPKDVSTATGVDSRIYTSV